MRSGAWGTVAIAFLAAALPGCLDDGSSVFGPVAGADEEDGDGTGGLLPVSFKAKPARGPTPLEAEFFLHVAGRPELEWSIDFGDGTPKATGDDLPANATHRFTKLGKHEVIASVGTGPELTRSRITLEVLEADAPPADPKEEAEGETLPQSSSSSSSSGQATSSSSGTEQPDPTASSTSTPPPPPPSSTQPPPPPPPPPSSSSTTSDPPPPPPPPPPSSSSTSSAPPPPPPPPSSSSTTSNPPPPPSGNEPPRATLVASKTSGAAPLDVAYSMDASDPEGRPITWTLDIRNDGSVEASGDRFDLPRTVNGRFDQPGTYVTVFTVSDGVATTTRSVTVTVT